MDDPAEDEPTGFVPSQHQARALERMRKQNHSKSPTKRRFRRVSVSVGSLGTAMKAMGMSSRSHGDNVVRMYRALLKRKASDRSDSDVELLSSMLKGIQFLAKLEPSQMKQVCRSIELKTFRARGLCIVRQGEKGDAFYILLRGSVSIYVRYEDSDEEQTGLGFLVGRCHAGESFGELALTKAEDMTRNASVVTDEATDCLVLSKATYRRILAHDHNALVRNVRTFLKKVPSLKGLDEDAATKLCHVFQRRVLPGGTIINTEGLPVNRLNFMVCIKRGQVEVLKSRVVSPAQEGGRHSSSHMPHTSRIGHSGADSIPPDSVVLCTLAPGHVIVDRAAMDQFEKVGQRNGARSHGLYELTVRAATRVELLTLSRYDYSRLVWPYTRCHAAVKADIIAPPSHTEVASLVQSSKEWERYKKKLITDVVLKNQRRKFNPMRRGKIPTRRSVEAAARITAAGSPGRMDTDALFRQKREARQRRLNHARRAKGEHRVSRPNQPKRRRSCTRRVAPEGLGGTRGQGARRGEGGRVPTPALPDDPDSYNVYHTRVPRGQRSANLPHARAFRRRGALPGRRQRGSAATQSRAGARRAASTRQPAHTPLRRQPKRHAPHTVAASASAPSLLPGRVGRGDAVLMPCPQWHEEHTGGVELSKAYCQRVGRGQSSAVSKHPSRSTPPRPCIALPISGSLDLQGAMRERGSSSMVHPRSPIPSLLQHARADVRGAESPPQKPQLRSPAHAASPPRRQLRFSSNPASPRAVVPSSQDESLPAMAKAHLHGYLSEGVALPNRFGMLRVSPLIEARMMQAIGFKDLNDMRMEEEEEEEEEQRRKRGTPSRSRTSIPQASPHQRSGGARRGRRRSSVSVVSVTQQPVRKSSAVVRSHMRMQIVASGPVRRRTDMLSALAKGAAMQSTIDKEGDDAADMLRSFMSTADAQEPGDGVDTSADANQHRRSNVSVAKEQQAETFRVLKKEMIVAAQSKVEEDMSPLQAELLALARSSR